ncbi:hypothetical protein FDP49_06995 [Enterococcus faecium]|uniref:hypothetical protein n=1 Tax=Enterococcus faecium TaxID=1352 RepID=UPI00129CD97F|nr:hypothetical protein [Enterococcus faecium]MCD5093969.1 hypothetical protein [Enterococcus faecium]MRJ04772.1 hypothetical protein [Enterococcus faecium]
MTLVNVIFILAIIWVIMLLVIMVVMFVHMHKEYKRMDEQIERRRKAFDDHSDEIRKKGLK